MNNLVSIKVQTAYIISTSISVSLSYFVYTRYLSDYNHYMAIALFSTINFTAIHLGYNYLAANVFCVCGLDFKREGKRITFDRFSKTDILIMVHALLVFGVFALMLPNLRSYEYAFIFILFGTLGRMAQVPLAYLILKERIRNYFNYTIGLILCSVGTIGYQLQASANSIEFSSHMLLIGLVYAIVLALSSVVFKYCTKKEHSGFDALTVLEAEKKSLLYQAVIALCVGFILLEDSRGVLGINTSQILALLCIGGIVGLAGIVTSRLINVLSIKTARVLDGYRILISIIAYLIFIFLFSEFHLNEVFDVIKVLCIGAIFLGTLLSKKADKLELDITGLTYTKIKEVKN